MTDHEKLLFDLAVREARFAGHTAGMQDAYHRLGSLYPKLSQKTEDMIARYEAALELIATPMRPDGTWNRDREACRQIASEALGRDGK